MTTTTTTTTTDLVELADCLAQLGFQPVAFEFLEDAGVPAALCPPLTRRGYDAFLLTTGRPAQFLVARLGSTLELLLLDGALQILDGVCISTFGSTGQLSPLQAAALSATVAAVRS